MKRLILTVALATPLVAGCGEAFKANPDPAIVAQEADQIRTVTSVVGSVVPPPFGLILEGLAGIAIGVGAYKAGQKRPKE